MTEATLRPARVHLHDLDSVDAQVIEYRLREQGFETVITKGVFPPAEQAETDLMVLKWTEPIESPRTRELEFFLDQRDASRLILVVPDRRTWHVEDFLAMGIRDIWTRFTTVEQAVAGIIKAIEEMCIATIRHSIVKQEGQQTFASIMAAFRRLFRFDDLLFATVEATRRQVTILFSAEKYGIHPGESYELAGSFSEAVMREGYPMINHDTSLNRYTHDKMLLDHGIHSVLIYPLYHQTQMVGSLTFLSHDTNAFSQTVIPLINEITSSLGALMAYELFVSRLKLREEELSEALQTKNNLLRVLSHDLKNPINTILMTSQMLDINSDRLSDEQRRKYVNLITTAARLQLQLLDDIMQLGLLDDSSEKGQWSNFDVNQCIHSVLELHAPIAQAKSISLNFDPELERSDIRSDMSKLIQVLSNLVNNAIKFTPNGKSISISALDRVDDIDIRIQDQGQGISPQVLEQSNRGERVESNKGTAGEPGTGLGLMISRQLLDILRGRLTFDSEPGQGTTATIRLPRETPTATPREVEPADERRKF